VLICTSTWKLRNAGLSLLLCRRYDTTVAMLRHCRVRLAGPSGRRSSVGSSGTWNTDFLAAIGASASNAALRHTVLRTPRRDLDEVVYLTSSNTVAQEHIGRVLGVNYGLLRQSKHWAQASPTNVLRLIDMFVQHRIPVDVHVQQAMATALTPMLPLITSLELVALLERLFALKLLLAPPILVSTVQALRDSMDMWFPSGADAVILQTGATAVLHTLQSVAACAPNQSTSDIAAYGLLLRDASYISARAAARLSLTAEGMATSSIGKEDTLVELYVTMVEVCALGRRVALTARRQCGYVVDAAAADLLDECDKLLAMGQASVTASLLHVVNPRGWHTRAAKDATAVSGWTMPATSVARVANAVCSMPESHRTFAVSAISHHMAHLINFPHGFGGTGLKKAHPQVLTLTDCLSLLVSMRSAELAAASVAPTVSLNAEGLARVGGRTTAMTYNGLLATTARLARRPTEGSPEEAHAELFPSVAIEGLRALCAVTGVTATSHTPLAHIHWTGRTADVAVLLQERLIAIVAEIDVRTTLMLLETIALQPTAAQCVSVGITSEVVERWWTSRRRLTDAALAAAYVHLGDPTTRLSAVDVCAVAALAKRVERIDASAGPNTVSVVGAAKVRFALARKDAIASSITLSSAYFAEPILRRLLPFATGTDVPYAALNQTFEEPQPAAVLHTVRAAPVEMEKEASGVTAVMPFDAFLLK
jgi:hypothetical protein